MRLTGPSQSWLTEIIKQNGFRVNDPKIIEAKHTEIRGSVKRDTFRSALITEFLNGSNMITEIYVLAAKSDENKEEICKARYDSGGHRDIRKDCLVHGAQAIQSVHLRTFL